MQRPRSERVLFKYDVFRHLPEIMQKEQNNVSVQDVAPELFILFCFLNCLDEMQKCSHLPFRETRAQGSIKLLSISLIEWR